MLFLLADPLNTSILRCLLHGPLAVSELPNRIRPMSRTTRFTRLRDLEDLGVIERQRRAGTPPVAFCSLSLGGRELVPVVRRFARWLALAPIRPSRPDEVLGAKAIRALAVAWETTVLRWLAERPCSLIELDALSPREVSYHEVRKAREALSNAGLITPVSSPERGQPYEPTDWARSAAACVAAAICWERRHLQTPMSGTVEVETLSLLRSRTSRDDALPPTEARTSLREVDALTPAIAEEADSRRTGIALSSR